MAVLAISGGDVALIILAGFWGLLVLFLAIVLINVFRMLESTKLLIDGIREETVPLLSEAKTTISSVNKELERIDGIMESAGKIVKGVERVAGLIEQAVGGPIVKLVAAGAGISRAAKRFRGGRH